MRLLAATFLLLSSSLASSNDPLRPIINLGYARYQGVFNSTTNVTRFFGVRYANSTAGTRRWTAPVTPTPTTELLQATDQPHSCPNALLGRADSNPPFLTRRQTSAVDQEDCLVLNIHVPGVLNPNKRLPILVYLHAGGYVFGGASLYPGDDVAQASDGNVIFIVVQYRLGLFGFLAGEEVHKNGVLNAGLLDQQAALKWIQKHASVLGGDPSKVTIWGDSAGGGAVLLHMIANGGQTHSPLFRNGISSSTYLPPQYPFDHAVPKALYAEIVREANCTSSTNTLKCLRETDYADLEAINAGLATSAFFGESMFIPVIDNLLFTSRPSLAVKNHKLNGHALLSVHNTFEGFEFVNQTTANVPGANLRDYLQSLLPDLQPANVDKALALYESPGSTVFEQRVAVMSDSIFICPSYALLPLFPGHTYKAEFAISPARHLDDVPYYMPSIRMTSIIPFGSPPAPVYDNAAFRKAFTEAFLDFTIHSDVNTKLSPDNMTPNWPAWSPSTHSRMVFNRTESGDPVVEIADVPSDLVQRCQFWASVSDQLWQ